MKQRFACQYDCPDTCGLLAEVEEGKITRVFPDSEHAHTRGFLCRKMNHYQEMINDPNRILYPMKRVGAKGQGLFERISWEEAVDTITSRWKGIIETYGSQAILPYSYAGTEGLLQKNCGIAFFYYLGASKLKRTICSSGKGAGWEAIMGDSFAMPTSQVSLSDLVLVWGSNLAATRLHDLPFVKEAKSRGAKIILIDVYETPAARFCDQVCLIRPGTDGALAMAMIHVMEKEGLADHAFIEANVEGYDRLLKVLPAYTPEWAEQETGLKADTIRELARAYGRAKAPAIILGSGPSRQFNGGMNTRCVTALPAVAGIWARGFGLCGLNHSGSWGNLDLFRRPDFDCHGARTINMMQLVSALADQDQPVKSLYVYQCNPILVGTRQKQMKEALEREDIFTVVHERLMTDTARYADIILPAVYAPEAYDLYAPYGYNGLQYSRKIAEAPGECRSNWDTFASLAKGMGFEDPYFGHTEEEMCLKFLDGQSGQQALLTHDQWDRLMAGYGVELPISEKPDIKTRNGRILFYNEEVADPLIGYKPADRHEGSQYYPLALVTAPALHTLNSTFNSQEFLVDKRGPMRLLMSSGDAAARGIAEGEKVICFNQWAQVEFYAGIIDGILPGTVVAEGVYTLDQSLNGLTVNALTGEGLSDLGAATTMNGNYVDVRKL